MASLLQIETRYGERWQVGWYDLDGTRHRKDFRLKREALHFKLELEHHIVRIKAGLEKRLNLNLPLKSVVDEYLQIVEKQKKPLTIRRERIVYNELLDFLNDIRIRHITTGHIDRYITFRLNGSGIKPATARSELRMLNQFFNILIDMQYVEINPVLKAVKPKVEPKIIRILTNKEVENLFKKIDSQDYRDLVTAYLHSGARKTEILPEKFTWDNVNFDSKKIRLLGKSDKIRYVPMDETLEEILTRRCNIEKHTVPFNFNIHYLYTKIKRYMTAAKINDADVHTLRRTFGSKLIEQGVDILTVSKLLGHSSVSVTQNHYIHLLDDHLAEGIKHLDSAWKK